jgi:hypothetical protein
VIKTVTAMRESTVSTVFANSVETTATVRKVRNAKAEPAEKFPTIVPRAAIVRTVRCVVKIGAVRVFPMPTVRPARYAWTEFAQNLNAV